MRKQCSRCGNNNNSYFYNGSKGWYCRKCIQYVNSAIKEEDTHFVDSEYALSFNLTKLQQEVSDKLVSYIDNNNSVLLQAVCGAGKTELVYAVIASQLKQGKKVCFAIPRRQVVLEIAARLSSVFTNLKVTAVCQGYTQDTSGDLIVCTTHQLYRFYQRFDLLIIDEPDAFPFKGNDLLHGFARSSCKGNFIYLTATPDEKLKTMVAKNQIQYVYLPKRPSGKDMIVPKVVYGSKVTTLLYGLYKAFQLVKNKQLVIFFMPTIKAARRLYCLLKLTNDCCQVDSLTVNKDEVINRFKSKHYHLCISTTVLERGITISGVHIIVWKADSDRFDEASLCQMAGRVGRDVKNPNGLCLFLATKKAITIDNCISSIIKANEL